MNWIKTIAFAWALGASSAWGAHVADFSPQGQVARVASIKLRFNTPVVAFGNAQAPAPVDIQCDDPELTGHGRWLDGSSWTYEFTQNPAPGVSCQVDISPSFRDLNDSVITGTTRFSFHTGGPSVSTVRPSYTDIAEDQMFVLGFNAAVDPATVASGTQCLVQGLGEVVSVRLITGDARKQILNSFRYSSLPDTQATQIVQCKRLLPPEAKVQLRVGPGISTVLDQRPAVANTSPDVFDFTVRAPFSASFSCRRENASMPCTPVSDMALTFSAPISRADAKKIRLSSPAGDSAAAIDPDDNEGADLTYLAFKGPFPESANITISLPPDLQDDAGRALVNADQFPLTVPTAAFPPLVKFSASPFGIIERFAHAPVGGREADHPPSLPLTLRNVEAALTTRELSVSAGQVADYATQDDQEVLRWYARVQRMDETHYTQAEITAIMADEATVYVAGEQPRIDTRSVSLLQGQTDVRKLVLPGLEQDGERPFEVIGVPLVDPGFHVLEVESPRLGQSLLGQAQPMYVRTTALVTNLGVHLKAGRDDILAWVTTLDDGQVVANAQINVLDCSGQLLAQGVTDEHGLWHHLQALPEDRYCSDNGLGGVYVSARIPADHPQARGKPDFSFVFSDWNDGIESWRFNVSTDNAIAPTRIAHTMFDRTLFRAGETVSMKHFLREQTRAGLAVPDADLPTRLIIQHQGSDERHELAVQWDQTASGGLSAQSQYAIPKTAKLGMYTTMLTDEQHGWYGGGEFRVEAFKLPLLSGSLKISDSTDSTVLVAPQALNADVQLAYVSGGPAGQLQVSLSGVLRDQQVDFADYDDYSFNPPEDDTDTGYDEEGYPLQEAHQQTLFLNKQPVTLDAQGGSRLAINTLPVIKQPRNLLFEASFADPNGEIQTLAQTVAVWPAAVVAGIRAGNWLPAGQPSRISTVALSPSGHPQANVPMTVIAQARTTYSTRQRMVGGFYSYQNRTQTRDLGVVCQGNTNAQGILECPADINESGRIQLVASATDKQGRVSTAATTVWIVGQDELWFGGNNDDRIDIIPSRKTWKPGEMAEFQVRMPFRKATALVAVEREGVLQTQVVHLKGSDPTVRLPVQASWGPNVYVSVLALRGRLRDVPWYSFFTWGWKQPTAWYDAYSNDGNTVVAPTTLIDLSKPSFRFGLTEIHVSDGLDQLQVEVTTDKQRYQVGEQATVTIRATTPDGKPAAHGTVAFAAVDQALLELSPNTSWDIVPAMRQLRSYGVDTATAQMQIVGRRHYGRKALPAGGGGGKSPTRELLDTLLLWQPDIQLDQEGKARLTLPLNDAITRFTLVAVADQGAERFGKGSASIISTQDVQVISGLPVQVREGDRYQAMVTVRNAAERDMSLVVEASYRGQGVDDQILPAQTVHLTAGAAQTLSWSVIAPESEHMDGPVDLDWVLEANEQDDTKVEQGAVTVKPAGDRLAFQQTLVPVYPVRTQQSTLVSLDTDESPLSVPVAAPDFALADSQGVPRGGLRIHLQSSLAGGLAGVQEWFRHYPYTCLEQVSSKAIGLGSQSQWDDIMANLPAYLDDDGLAAYFPGASYGNEVLTAYLLSVSHEAQVLGLPFKIPQSVRQQMLDGLRAYAQGKLRRTHWSPVKDNDVRKLLALEALSRHEPVTPRMLDSLRISPDKWPTSAVIDWMALLQRMPAMPDQARYLSQARQIILGRMLSRGTELVFEDSSQNNWWWLMVSPETNLAKLMLVTLGQGEWKADQARMAQGLLNLQRRGAWSTTTSNLLGTLAIQKFAQHFEGRPVSGTVQLQLYPGEDVTTLDWAQAKDTDGIRSLDYLQPWDKLADGVLLMQPQGQGQAWASISSLAAIAPSKPVVAGYQLQRTVTPVTQQKSGAWSRGDVYRVSITMEAKGGMSWAALTDPVPAGATILGSGLGRDSSIATETEVDNVGYQPSFIERGVDSWRAYYEYLPAGKTTVEYTVRLNTPGQFQLPPTRIETLYNPEVYGELPHPDSFVVHAEQGR